jgi:hypothetical protein
MVRIHFGVVFCVALNLLRDTLASASNGMGDFLQRRDSTKTITIPFHTLVRTQFNTVLLFKEEISKLIRSLMSSLQAITIISISGVNWTFTFSPT